MKAGIVAKVVSAILFYPLEVINTIQILNVTRTVSVAEVFHSLWQQNIRAFYKGFSVPMIESVI